MECGAVHTVHDMRLAVVGQMVHKFQGWADLKGRLGPGRRVYAFFHSSMPEEPLVILHVALMDCVATSIGQVLDLVCTPPGPPPLLCKHMDHGQKSGHRQHEPFLCQRAVRHFGAVYMAAITTMTFV